jgi:hypothetical protein
MSSREDMVRVGQARIDAHVTDPQGPKGWRCLRESPGTGRQGLPARRGHQRRWSERRSRIWSAQHASPTPPGRQGTARVSWARTAELLSACSSLPVTRAPGAWRTSAGHSSYREHATIIAPSRYSDKSPLDVIDQEPSAALMVRLAVLMIIQFLPVDQPPAKIAPLAAGLAPMLGASPLTTRSTLTHCSLIEVNPWRRS